MYNSADIRKDNRKRVYHCLLDGEAHTKQQIAHLTGLSVATCNTLLNELTIRGYVCGDEKVGGESGRSAVLYRINENREHFLLLRFTQFKGNRFIEAFVYTPLGQVLKTFKRFSEHLSYEEICMAAEEALKGDQAVSRIILGLPGILHREHIRFCDFPELNDMPLKSLLEEALSLPVFIENDMYFMAFGYSRLKGFTEGVITLAVFPYHLLPAAVTIHNGKVIKGTHGIAGLLGFLPFPGGREELIRQMEPASCIPFMHAALASIITLYNPEILICSGELIDPGLLEEVRNECLKSIPAEFIPQFIHDSHFDDYYLYGMYQTALSGQTLL